MEEYDVSQAAAWRGAMGQAYTDRSPHDVKALDALYARTYGVSAQVLNELLLVNLDRSMRVLECGANVGVQLLLLEKMGFSQLYGLEIQHGAASQAPSWFHYTQGSILRLPYQAGAFDLVFTSGVLIHVAPGDIPQALAEMRRVSGRYIWGHEYYAPDFQEVPWRGLRGQLWRGDYAGLFLEMFPDLKLKHQILLGNQGPDNVDRFYLLERG